jgi:hypothetical protein
MSEVTPIEIALDLETTLPFDRSRFDFSGAAEPRVCLVAAFALTAQLKRIVGAVNRAVPARAPSGLRIAPLPVRSATVSPRVLSIEPMLVLQRLQSKLIRAIEPGVTCDQNAILFGSVRDMGAEAERFVRDFVPRKSPPMLTPQYAVLGSESLNPKAVGITIYRLGNLGLPESIIAHWGYAEDPRGNLHLKSGP